ncbi:MAG: hypothetical protein AAF125_14855 [Chloroflexota bacterium]
MSAKKKPTATYLSNEALYARRMARFQRWGGLANRVFMIAALTTLLTIGLAIATASASEAIYTLSILVSVCGGFTAMAALVVIAVVQFFRLLERSLNRVERMGQGKRKNDG